MSRLWGRSLGRGAATPAGSAPYPPPLAPLAAQRWDVVGRILADVKPRTVLEIGCGLGGFGSRLATVCEYLGVEADRTSFEAARPVVEAARGCVVHGSCRDVDRSGFDLVCAFEVIEHLDDDVAALREWAEKARPGGSVLLSVPAGPERLGAWDLHVGHYRRYDAAGMDRLLAGAGLQQQAQIHYGWPLGFATEAVRNLIAGRRPGRDASMSERTAGSGRILQPGRRTGLLVPPLVTPFLALQRTRPTVGVGLVVLARKPG